MQPLLYRDLIDYYRLIDPYEDHLEEATVYAELLLGAAVPRPKTLLELGAGAGGNAYHLKRTFRCTLTDLSEEMLGLSRALNPECEHLPGDMRTLRLGRTFDAVLIHDAIMYMTTEEELRAAVETAFEHTRPGGAALFTPDVVRDTFSEGTTDGGGSDGARAVRYVEWSWDPDPTDTTCTVDYAFLIRNGDEVKAVHDRHIEGVFPIATWQRVLESVGFAAEPVRIELFDGEHIELVVFMGRRPR